MRQGKLFEHEDLFERLCSKEELLKGFKAVKKNKGAPGIDGVTIRNFTADVDKEIEQLMEELRSWNYEPKPVRRVIIPKPNGKGDRQLGIPCVRDRVVQATIKNLIEPLLEPHFSSNSYGFRPGRSQRQAVEAAQKIVQSGKGYIVDIDLAKFFDRIQHDRLMARLRKHVPSKPIRCLIGKMLRSGIMVGGLVKPTTEGAVQGGPLSPLLSNLVLDELDKELERRGLEFCRYADDCNIFVRTRKAADRIMGSITTFIEKKLKLKVNNEKSKTGPSHKVKFLGMTIIKKTIAISKDALAQAMQKVKELTPRGTHLTLEETIKKINQWYLGWSIYFMMTQYPAQLKKIEAHIRRRLRRRIISQHKRKRFLFRKLCQRGVNKGSVARTVYGNRKWWALSHTQATEKAYPNKWFIESLGQHICSDQEKSHWFDERVWIALT